MVKCNICGGERFTGGPGGRLSTYGKLPHCVICGSLERHRIARQNLREIRSSDHFRKFRVLHISNDPIVIDSWFDSVERSYYNGTNSIDIQKIDRESSSYHMVVCCHVVEHVENHRRAILEMTRVLRPDGILYLAYPNPASQSVTCDWGFPDPRQHGHYRTLGRDFERELAQLSPTISFVGLERQDDVTGTVDLHYLGAKNSFWLIRALNRVSGSRLIT